MMVGRRLNAPPAALDAPFAVWEDEGGALNRRRPGRQAQGRDLMTLGTMLAIYDDLPADMRLGLFADIYVSLQPVRA